MAYTTLDQNQDVDLSYHDDNSVRAISKDGQFVVFEDSSEPAGPAYAGDDAQSRRLPASPPGRRQLRRNLARRKMGDFDFHRNLPQVTLLPIGPGQSRAISVTGLEHVQNGFARFLPDGHRFAINGNGAGQATRLLSRRYRDGKGETRQPGGHHLRRLFSGWPVHDRNHQWDHKESTLCETALRTPSRTCTLISLRSSGRITAPSCTATISASSPARSTRRKSPPA